MSCFEVLDVRFLYLESPSQRPKNKLWHFNQNFFSVYLDLNLDPDSHKKHGSDPDSVNPDSKNGIK
jgi:hypothetical protein